MSTQKPSSFEVAVAEAAANQPKDMEAVKRMSNLAAQYGLQAEVAVAYTKALLIRGETIQKAVRYALNECDL